VKVVTIGTSPYLLTSNGRIHSWIIEHFYNQGHEIASLVHTHDTSYFVPDETETGIMYTYKIGDNKVPLLPYKKGGESPEKTEVIQIYEALELLKPDLLVTVDDYEGCLYMQAVKMFMPDKFKWLFVILNGSLPFNEQSRPLVEHADAILCSNEFTYRHIKDFYSHPLMDWHYVGADHSTFFRKKNAQKKSFFSVFSSCKNTLKDCPWVILEACRDIHKDIPELKLNMHINLHDNGFYHFGVLQERFDPDFSFLNLPQEYASIKEGCSDKEMNEMLNESHFFVSSSLLSSSSLGIFEAMSAGCMPLVSNQGADAEIIKKMKEEAGENFNFIYKTMPFMMSGEKMLNVPDVASLKNLLIEAKNILKEEKKYQGIVDSIYKYSKGYDHLKFLERISDLAQETVRNNTKVFSLT